MDLKRLLKGVAALTFVTLATSQRLPTQHPFYSSALFEGARSNTEGDLAFEPPLVLPRRENRDQKLAKIIGSISTPTEITFDSYNAAFPAQLQPFRLENNYWSPDRSQGQKRVDERIFGIPQHVYDDGRGNGMGNGFDDALYPAADADNLSIEHDDDKQQNKMNAKDQNNELLLLLLLLNDADKPSRRCENTIEGKSSTKQQTDEKPQLLNFQPEADDQLQTFDGGRFRKRNVFRNLMGRKSRSHDSQKFQPSISSGAMTNLGHFFKDLKSNVNYMENRRFGPTQQKLLDGDHPVSVLREELLRSGDGGSPSSETAAFLHAIRTYRPSQKIRSLVSMNPAGYHGSQFLDPNYMWLGLGK